MGRKGCLTSMHERTGWRDLALSERHRRYGFDCPAVDLDFVLLEYDAGKAAAVVEFKHERAAPQYPNQPSFRALADLGNRAVLPVLACRYESDFSWWKVVPLNEVAKKFVPDRVTMTEREWVSLLYRLRGRDAPDSVLNNIDVEFISLHT